MLRYCCLGMSLISTERAGPPQSTLLHYHPSYSSLYRRQQLIDSGKYFQVSSWCCHNHFHLFSHIVPLFINEPPLWSNTSILWMTFCFIRAYSGAKWTSTNDGKTETLRDKYYKYAQTFTLFFSSTYVLRKKYHSILQHAQGMKIYSTINN